MSTRGAIAFGDEVCWDGLYNHSDSYPTWLGKILWQERPTADLLDLHPGGFSSYPDVCYCHDEYFAKRDGSAAKDSPYYSPDAQWGYIHSADGNPLFIKWVYVFDNPANRLHVLAAREVKMRPEWKLAPGECRRVVDVRGVPVTVYVECAYKHVCVGSYDLDGPEPDWEKVEAA